MRRGTLTALAMLRRDQAVEPLRICMNRSLLHAARIRPRGQRPAVVPGRAQTGI